MTIMNNKEILEKEEWLRKCAKHWSPDPEAQEEAYKILAIAAWKELVLETQKEAEKP